MAAQYYGWDLGGAHIKVARLDAGGELLSVEQRPCRLWNGIEELRGALHEFHGRFQSTDAVHAVTMTGELCDVFADRGQGVQAIVHCFGEVFDHAEIVIYGGYDGWLSVAEAPGREISIASANWLALATFMAERSPNSLILDIGSTTTDIVLISNGEVRCEGRGDAARLACDELVYTGVVRTPVMAVCDRVPFGGRWQNLAAEYFAVMADVYRITGWLGEGDDQMDTADGQAKDVFSSARRLARMLGYDYAPRDFECLARVAHFIADVQLTRIEHAMACVMSRLVAREQVERLIAAGVGSFLALRLAAKNRMHYFDFGTAAGAPEHLARATTNCAPAVSLAKLAWMTR